MAGDDSLISKHRWLPFVLPLAVFLLIGTIEPKPMQPSAIPYAAYPWIYTLKIVLTLAALVLVRSVFTEFLPLRVTPLAIIVGIAGAAIWIGLARLRLEERFFHILGWHSWTQSVARSQFNPFQELAGHAGLAWGFFAMRLLGMVVIIALAEELFLRGWMMRFFVADEWWNVPFGQLNALAIAAGTIVPMLSHPGELLAAAVWFSMVTWLMATTKNLWDCIAAHALTNLLLAIYVAASGHWQLM